MEKFDLVKPHKSYFSAKPVKALKETEKASFISISGKGDPSGVDFAENIGAL